MLLANDAAGLFNANILGLVAAVVVCLIAAIALLRLSLVLPAVAVGERLSPAQAWRCTRGNTFRWAMAAVLCVLPAVPLLLLPTLVVLIVVLPGFSPESAVNISRSYWHVVPASVFQAVLTILEITLLSLAYSFFTGPGDGRASPSA